MNSPPTWTMGVVAPLVLLSPVIALLLALAAEGIVVALHDAPVPVGATLGIGAVGLYLFRKQRTRAAQASEDVN